MVEKGFSPALAPHLEMAVVTPQTPPNKLENVVFPSLEGFEIHKYIFTWSPSSTT